MKNGLYNVNNLKVAEVFVMSLPTTSDRPVYTSTGEVLIFDDLKGRYKEVLKGTEVSPIAEEYSHLNGNLFVGEFEDFVKHFPEYANTQMTTSELYSSIENQNRTQGVL